MMADLIIGGDGFIGRNLCRHLPNAAITTRRNGSLGQNAFYFDMEKRGPLPDADIVYICAGVNGTLTCSQEPQRSYRVNVDGTIYIAEHYRDRAFVVWISSTTVEWLTEHYGRQKHTAELYLRAMPHVGIVRAGRVMQSNVDELCTLMIRMGLGQEHQIVLWNEDERPYAH